MSDFKQACKWMEEGKKVRISSWENEAYYWWVDTDFSFDNLWCIRDSTWKEGDDENDACLIRSWVESDDWEIYKESKDDELTAEDIINAMNLLDENKVYKKIEDDFKTVTYSDSGIESFELKPISMKLINEYMLGHEKQLEENGYIDFYGIKVIVSDNVKEDEAELRDSITGEIKGKIENIGYKIDSKEIERLWRNMISKRMAEVMLKMLRDLK